MKKFSRVLILLMVFAMLSSAALPLYAAASYSTYTYSISGSPLSSPDAYTPYKTYKSTELGLDVPFDDPADIFVDDNMDIYIVDRANNRVLIFSEYMSFKSEISTFTNEQGVPDKFASPSGVFVTEEKIFVADTENNRIVVFDRDGEFLKVLEAPKADVFPEGAIYKPIALAVDAMERLYVVSSTTYMGVIVLDAEGEFQSFIGAQAAGGGSTLEIVWDSIKSAASKKKTSLSSEYNNIAMDSEGMLYVTTTSIGESAQRNALKSKEGTYAPVKKLNANGEDIMARNGFFSPGGEVVTGDEPVSKLVDVATGPEGTFSVIDNERQRIYTYDNDGNLLFAFGDVGTQLGNLVNVTGIVYQGTKILVLDSTEDSITVFNRTEYGDILIEALKHNNNRQYDLAVSDYETILQHNSNFDVAYVGIGTANYRDGNWTEAMEYYEYAFDTDNYSKAFKMWRQEWISKYVIVIPIVVIAFFWVLFKFMGYASKVNKRTALSKTKRTYKQELLYANHLIFHPFDGFWDLKHEKRGSVRAAVTFILLAIAAFTYQAVGQAYLFNPEKSFSSVAIQAVGITVPILLWVTANWCLTTLFEGEGSFRDVFIATGYSLAPMPIFIIIATMLTNVFTLQEASIVTFLQSIAWIWVGFLVFLGMMITHDYSIAKSVITAVGTIVGMAFVIFMMLLFSTLIVKIVSFISNIVVELSYRV